MSEDSRQIGSMAASSGTSNVSGVPSAEMPVGEAAPDPATRERKWLLPAGLLLGLLLLGGIGWQIFSKLMAGMGGAGMGARAFPVQIQELKATPITDSSDYVASLQSRQSATLQPRVSGQIIDILVRAGDRVDAGQAVLRLDDREQAAALENRVAAVETTQADVQSAQADAMSARDTLRSLQAQRQAALANVQLNQQEFQRFQELFRQGAASRQILDQRLNSLQTAQASLSQIEANIQAQQSAINRADSTIVRNERTLNQAQATVEQQQAQLGYYTINAPFSGIVGNIPVRVGDFVSNTSVLMTITQNQDLEVQIQVPLEQAPQLRRGMPVQLLDAKDKPIQTGRVFFISPTVDPQTQSILIRANFQNNKGQLRTEQFSRVRLIWSERPDGLVVPLTAISRLAGQNFAFVAEPYSKRCKAKESTQGNAGGGKPPDDNQLVASQYPIKIGKVVGNEQEVLEGLKVGDRIVTSGLAQLRDCQPIMELPANQQPPSGAKPQKS